METCWPSSVATENGGAIRARASSMRSSIALRALVHGRIVLVLVEKCRELSAGRIVLMEMGKGYAQCRSAPRQALTRAASAVLNSSQLSSKHLSFLLLMPSPLQGDSECDNEATALSSSVAAD